MRSVFSTPISHLCVIKPSIGEPKVGDQHETRTYDQDQKPLQEKIEKIQDKSDVQTIEVRKSIIMDPVGPNSSDTILP